LIAGRPRAGDDGSRGGHGADVGEVAQYGDSFRLSFVRGADGVGPAGQFG
jgi:hypothetical protein